MDDVNERMNGPEGEGQQVPEVVPEDARTPEAMPQQPADPGVGWYHAPEPGAPRPAAPGAPFTPPRRVRPKTNWWLFAAGIVTPPVVYYALVTVLSVAIPSSSPAYSTITTGIVLVVPVSFAVLLVWFLMTRSAGKARLASFLKGAVWSYAIIPLGFLLLFGACFLPR